MQYTDSLTIYPATDKSKHLHYKSWASYWTVLTKHFVSNNQNNAWYSVSIAVTSQLRCFIQKNCINKISNQYRLLNSCLGFLFSLGQQHRLVPFEPNPTLGWFFRLDQPELITKPDLVYIFYINIIIILKVRF